MIEEVDIDGSFCSCVNSLIIKIEILIKTFI
jgi:hypothetical protein